MKLNDVKIKDDINPELIAQAIEFVANSCFTSDSSLSNCSSFISLISFIHSLLKIS